MAKLCIVAAIGPGMGLAIAQRFAREGFDLAVIGRSAPADPAILDALAAHGGVVRSYAADLSDPKSVAGVMAEMKSALGAADVLVYNGGVWNEGPPLAQAADAFHRDLHLCVTGTYVCAQAVVPDMKAKGGGAILFTGGGLALNPQYGTGVLSLVAGKSALRGLGLALHEALKPDNIHVAQVTIAGTVAPGTAFDPNAIAEAYWSLYVQPRDAWTAERVFTGA
jgi:NAD(P)-dependent dehydrogenase (short-subunit alcohol dehydrogenase family)